jgi:hypothetical protein
MPDYQTVNKPLTWFRANAENYRSHPQEQQIVLQESLRRFGVFRNVVARPDGTLLAGHGILAAAQAEGLTEFPCVIFEGTDEEARALMVADNEQQRLAVDDEGQLTALLASIADSEIGVAVTGWNDDELASLLDVGDAEFSPAEDSSGDEKTMADKYLVAVVVDGATHELLRATVGAEALPGESVKETLARVFPELVRSRQNKP